MSFISRLKYIKKKNTLWYRNDYKKFISLCSKNDFIVKDSFPCVKDKFLTSGLIGSGGHYFFQDIYVAREIFLNNPLKHVDIGSRIDGFISHISVYREVEVFDIRPQDIKLKNVLFRQADLMNINPNLKDYCDSISCLHTIEHFGLGRYGDEIDPNGHLKGFNSITDILKPNGLFYFSVPMGEKNRIEFNAHRIFSLAYLISWVTKTFTIEKFSFIDDYNQIKEDVLLDNTNISSSFGCQHGCAIFTLKKIL